ncbi:MAG: toxin-antitoxin system HicB family antitoxin [Acidimicrobiia bacterium]
MAKARTTTAIRFPEELHRRLREAAEERDLSINFMVVKAVEEMLENLVPANELRLTRTSQPAA